MSEPIHDIQPIEAPFRHVHRDTMPEDVHMRPIVRQGRRARVVTKQKGHIGRRDRFSETLSARKQIVRPVLARLVEIGREEALRSRKERVRMGGPVLHAVDLKRIRSEVEIIEVNETGFGSPESVVVDEIEKKPIPQLFPRDRAKEPTHLADREMLDLGASPRWR